jgi:hypothetical protein
VNRNDRSTLALASAFALWLSGCAGAPRFTAEGTLLGDHVTTTVDSADAAYYLSHYLSEKRTDERRDAQIARLHDSLPSGVLPNRDLLRQIAQQYSPDYAALFFADCVARQDQNVRLHDKFNRHLSGQDLSPADRAACSHYRVLYVVSASSAGPAVHLAISQAAAAHQRIPAAWIDLGGILQGSPLIEYIRRPPQSLLFAGYSWWKGWDRKAIASMGAEVSRARFRTLHIPSDVLIINYVGLSLSGSLSKYARDKYPILLKDGPNDGLTPLADIVAPNSLALVAPSSDHFFAQDPHRPKDGCAGQDCHRDLGSPVTI